MPDDGQFWGKYDEQAETWHSLLGHSADVAAVAEALLEKTLLGRRLARLGGRDSLPEVWIARLGWLAAVHDYGKANLWFQAQIRDGRRRFGHVAPAWDLLLGRVELSVRLRQIFDLTAKLPWFGGSSRADQEDAFGAALSATVGHHGRPLSKMPGQVDPRPWSVSGGVDPLAEVERLTAAADRWFPQASAPDAEPFPPSSGFWHAWNGVLTLADWLGSTTAFFPFEQDPAHDRMPEARALATKALAKVGLDVAAARGVLDGEVPGFDRLIGVENAAPRPAQAASRELAVGRGEKGSISVLEAPTGEGKTEAALWRFLALFAAGEVDGLYFALPTRTAATQIYRRVCNIIKRVFADPDSRPPVVQAVPGYVSADGVEAQILGPFEVLWPDDEADRRRHRAWAAERPKRFLAATIAVGTIDQVLLSALRVRHAHLRALPLLRQLLVVDEVHASDVYMTRLLEVVLENQAAAGGHALLMSATLGGAVRHSLLNAYGRRGRRRGPDLAQCLGVPFPVLAHRERDGEVSQVGVEAAGERARAVAVHCLTLLEDAAGLAEKALEAARGGARVLVIRNTVAGALEVQAALEALAAKTGAVDRLFAIETESGPAVTLHHARFARSDRELLDEAIEKAFDPSRREIEGVVAVATQTVQQSLDLDADLLISDLCPLDVLLQRIGRLHRHAGPPRPSAFETPTCLVAVPRGRELEAFIGRGAHGLGSVYPDLRVIEASWRELEKREALRVPDDCRELVERSTHPDALSALSKELAAGFEQHQVELFGRRIAERRLASQNVIDWTRPIYESLIGDQLEKLRTRLGEEDVRVRFPDGETLRGPFDAMLKDLSLPHHFLSPSVDISFDEVAERLEAAPSQVRFRFAGRSYVYDRLGVRPEDA